MIFDILMLIICCALTCHLGSVSNAISSLGHKGSIDNTSRNDLIELNAKQDILFHDLNIIITDHQNVIEKLNEYLNIFRAVILVQIFIASNSHVIIWFIAALNFSKVYNGESLSSLSLTVKLFFLLPIFTIQLFMTCYLFETINEKKDSIILALYSSNWIDMDIRNKRLILLAMKTNNSNQLKMKFTYTKIVNLEMYSNTMRLCYSIFSMLIKYNQNKITSD
ncbi:Olfactory receptor, insect [Cinara cedri]|uniref:Olfactory receptor, insect n=1 Tax=Cinara cedri TaxID=506608 RepID=A0A5E4MFG4_9HEMI|nr:Olfactory receptor, insect [Cinara cedri]